MGTMATSRADETIGVDTYQPTTNPRPGNNCWPDPEVAENVNKEELGDLGLTEAEEWALVAFMKTLSDGWAPPAQ